jgi:hypothetical protein
MLAVPSLTTVSLDFFPGEMPMDGTGSAYTALAVAYTEVLPDKVLQQGAKGNQGYAPETSSSSHPAYHSIVQRDV